MRFLSPFLRVLIGDSAMVGHLAAAIKMGEGETALLDGL
jgi:hypothetical protein